MDEHRWQTKSGLSWQVAGSPFALLLRVPSRPFVQFRALLETNPIPTPSTLLSSRSDAIINAITTELGTVSCFGSDYLMSSSCLLRQRQVCGLEKAALSYGGAFRFEVWNRQEGPCEVLVVVPQ